MLQNNGFPLLTWLKGAKILKTYTLLMVMQATSSSSVAVETIKSDFDEKLIRGYFVDDKWTGDERGYLKWDSIYNSWAYWRWDDRDVERIFVEMERKTRHRSVKCSRNMGKQRRG
jgi:hypothetical protein